MPNFDSWDKTKLTKHIKEMDSTEFWQQKGVLSVREGKVDSAIDYFRQGLRKFPNDVLLIYSVARSYAEIYKFESALTWYTFGLNLQPRWVEGLVGIATIHFNRKNFEEALRYISLAKENIKGNTNILVKSPLITYDSISLIQATCLKKTGHYNAAANAYISLDHKILQLRSKALIPLLWGLVLVPLESDRKIIADHYNNLCEYLEHLSDAPTQLDHDQNLLLSQMCEGSKDNVNHRTGRMLYQDFKKDPPKLDFNRFPKAIWVLL